MISLVYVSSAFRPMHPEELEEILGVSLPPALGHIAFHFVNYYIIFDIVFYTLPLHSTHIL